MFHDGGNAVRLGIDLSQPIFRTQLRKCAFGKQLVLAKAEPGLFEVASRFCGPNESTGWQTGSRIPGKSASLCSVPKTSPPCHPSREAINAFAPALELCRTISDAGSTR